MNDEERKIDLTEKYGALLEQSIEEVGDSVQDEYSQIPVIDYKDKNKRGFYIFGSAWFYLLGLFFVLNLVYYSVFSYDSPVKTMAMADAEVVREIGVLELLKPFQSLRDMRFKVVDINSSNFKQLKDELDTFFDRDEFGRGFRLEEEKFIFSDQGFHYYQP